MNRFRDLLVSGARFVHSYELVPGRGARGARIDAILEFADQAGRSGLLDAVSLTDNPGGGPALSPDALGAEIKGLGIDPIVHFSAKDENRNRTEAQALALDRAGVENLLAVTGDYPTEEHMGLAKPVFDLDSVQLLDYLSRMTEYGRLKWPPSSAYRRGLLCCTAVLVVCALLCLGYPSYSAPPELDSMVLPPDFEIELFAPNLGPVRFMASGPSGTVFVSVPRAGRILALPDRDGDGAADTTIVFAVGLNLPHGLAFRDGDLYVAETDGVVRLRDQDGDLRADDRETIIEGLPADGGHWTRTLGFGPDGKLYVSIGSSCNVCIEEDPRRAAIVQYDPDGTGARIYATGLRNSVGIAWHPETGEMWATDNGRDWLGDDQPPDEINIVGDGGFYGWPYCYGQSIVDPEYGDLDRCAAARSSAVELQAHSAPLGLAFYTGMQFPDVYQGDLFVAYHGSWNRSVPTGYKVVRVRMVEGTPVEVEDFATGWLREGTAWGRPVDILVWTDGSLLASDDRAGAIYRIRYTGPRTEVEEVKMGGLSPDRYRLEPNYPNPFNAATAIRYRVEEAGRVTLSLYDLSGQELLVLVDNVRPAGEHSVIWDGLAEDGELAASGVYLVRMTADDFASTRKVVLLR